jgi:transposase-like protein
LDFSKWLELVLLLNRSNEGVAYAFLHKMFNKFGAPIEVLTNQGAKFCGKFQELCEKTLIDHQTTSHLHKTILKWTWLTKWMVQMMK